MDEFKPKLETFYYDPSKYKSYLEQLGIKYPTVRDDQREAVKKQLEKDKAEKSTPAAKVSSSRSE